MICPSCDSSLAELRAVTPGTQCEPGDIILCSSCGAVYIYQTNANLRRMTNEEILNLPEDELADLRFAVRNIVTAIRQRKRPIIFAPDILLN